MTWLGILLIVLGGIFLILFFVVLGIERTLGKRLAGLGQFLAQTRVPRGSYPLLSKSFSDTLSTVGWIATSLVLIGVGLWLL